MESLSETDWDVVISGTGLQQSILALALSRSDKKIIHVDSEACYGGAEAAFTLREAEQWAQKHASTSDDAVFSAAEVTKSGELAATRAYSLALAPQLIHSRSDLLNKLVSSKAFRQIEFLAVGSFYIYQQPSEASEQPFLSRIPSTREDVFSNTAIPVRAKRSLMKFLKFVMDYQSDSQTELWQAHADEPLDSFLASQFNLDESLRSYVTTLTLSLDGSISVGDGLTAISRHLNSMGVFGAGFAAVYPKWGGLSEVAQVGCRACAVGGGVYMLGTGVKDVQKASDATDADSPNLQISLADENNIRARSLFQGAGSASSDHPKLARLTAVVSDALPSVFEVVVEGAPTPSVAVVAFPAGSLSSGGVTSKYPIYAMVHSSDAGECPSGQCVVYLSTMASPESKPMLSSALTALLVAAAGDAEPGTALYQLYYEQRGARTPSLDVDGKIATFGLSLLDLAFNDMTLDPVRQAWELAMGPEAKKEDVEYLVFDDREGANDDDDAFD